MRPLLLVFFALMGYTQLSAQDSLEVIIKSGTKVEETLRPADIYYYPQFTKGEIFFRGGLKGTAKLNYTRVFDEMLFINANGDTLAIGEAKTIKFIVIDRDTFCYDEGYVKVIADDDFVKLAEKQVWVVVNIRKVGPHNTTTSSVSTTSVRTYRDANNEVTRNTLTLNEDIVLRKETQYYIGDEYNHFARPIKKKLYQLFPKEQRSLDNYFKENKVDIDKKEDVEKLFHFLSQLHLP